MGDAIRDANLALLIELRQHLEHAEKLRALLDNLLRLAKTSVTSGNFPDPGKDQAETTQELERLSAESERPGH